MAFLIELYVNRCFCLKSVYLLGEIKSPSMKKNNNRHITHACASRCVFPEPHTQHFEILRLRERERERVEFS